MEKIILAVVLTCPTQPPLHSLSVPRQPDGTTKVPDVLYPPRPAFRTIVVLGGIRVVSRGLRQYAEALSFSTHSAYLSRIGRADERTRTADLISLRVIHQALQGFARACKCRIFRRLSLLWVSECCTVLRSRWCQSGIRSP